MRNDLRSFLIASLLILPDISLDIDNGVLHIVIDLVSKVLHTFTCG